LEGVAGQLLAPSLAMVMLGFFMTVGRRLAVSQAIGLVIMENGVFLAGTGLTYGMPLIVELGTLLDLLIGVGVMGVLISRMHETLSTTDTSHLQNLKG
jgi:hydrogenase-4 membrane subunit HyfE